MSHTYPDPIQGANSPFAKTFPHQPTPYYSTPIVPTISLRDYFAAAALPSVDQRSSRGNPDEIAFECYQLADAMLKAREVKP